MRQLNTDLKRLDIDATQIACESVCHVFEKMVFGDAFGRRAVFFEGSINAGKKQPAVQTRCWLFLVYFK
jgi:hypothetical protein